jgi:predicted nucleotidyltransferase
LKDFVFKDNLSPILLYRLSEMTAAELRDVADVSEGIENRILRLAGECVDAESLVKAVSTKRYTESRVRRILVNALLRVDQDTFESGVDAPPYYKVLGVKKIGRTSFRCSLAPAPC